MMLSMRKRRLQGGCSPVWIEEYETVAANQVDATTAGFAAEQEHKLPLLLAAKVSV